MQATQGNQFMGAYYPWGRWFARAARGKVRLVRGADYACRDHGMASQLRTRAIQRGVSVSVVIGDGWVDFRVRPRKPGGYKRGRKPGGRL